MEECGFGKTREKNSRLWSGNFPGLPSFLFIFLQAAWPRCAALRCAANAPFSSNPPSIHTHLALLAASAILLAAANVPTLSPSGE